MPPSELPKQCYLPSSPLPTSTPTTGAPTRPSEQPTERKTAAFFARNATAVIVEMWRNGIGNAVRLGLPGDTALDTLFRSGQRCTCGSVPMWRSLVAGVGYQAHCNKQGINVQGSVWSHSRMKDRFRIGIFNNEQNDCNTCDSGRGVGNQMFSAGAFCEHGSDGKCGGEYSKGVWVNLFVVRGGEPETCSCYTPRTGDCGGNDMTIHASRSKAECDTLCHSEPGCRGYTYSKTDERLDGGGCITKSKDCSTPVGDCSAAYCFWTNQGFGPIDEPIFSPLIGGWKYILGLVGWSHWIGIYVCMYVYILCVCVSVSVCVSFLCLCAPAPTSAAPAAPTPTPVPVPLCVRSCACMHACICVVWHWGCEQPRWQDDGCAGNGKFWVARG